MRTIIYYLAFLIVFSCSSDSDPNDNNGNPSTNFLDVTVIGESDGEVLQTDLTDVTDTSQSETEFNLTTDLGLIPTYDYLNVEGNLLSFFDRILAQFQVFQKNIATQNSFAGDNLCALDTDEFELLATNSSDRIILLTIEPLEELFIRIFNPSTGDCTKIAAGTGFDGPLSTSVVVHNNSVYLAHKINGGAMRIARFGISSGQLEDEVVFNQDFAATFRNNEMLVFFFDGNYSSYNSQTFDFISDNGSYNTTPSLLNFSIGLSKRQFQGDKMLIDYFYAQPSLISKGPAVLNLSTGALEEGSDGFLFNVNSELVNTFQTAVVVSPIYAVDLTSGRVVVGFANNSVFPSTGGIIYTNFDGDIDKIIELPYVPDEIIIR